MRPEADAAFREVKIQPEREFTSEGRYRWFVFGPEQTSIPLVGLEDLETGVIVSTTVSHPEKRIASLRAWSGARHSRAPGYSWEILREIVQKEVDSDERVGETFLGYGHASPGDMAWLGVHIENVPMHFCMSVFNNLSLNSGQEKSTRYQKRFAKSVVEPLAHYLPSEILATPEGQSLENGYQELADMAAYYYAKHRQRIEEKYREHFPPGNAAQENALTARTLDTARAFLLLGQASSQFVGDTARNFSRLIGELKSSPIPLYGRVARQLQRLFAPSPEEEAALGQKAEAPALIRHTGTAPTVTQNLGVLKRFVLEKTDFATEAAFLMPDLKFRGAIRQNVEYLPGRISETERLAAQYLSAIWPGLGHTQILSWVDSLSREQKSEMGQIIFRGHGDKQELPAFARTTAMTAIINGSLAEVRDLNRHRSSGRFIELPTVFGLPMDSDTLEQVLAKGYVLPLYLTDVPEFRDLKDMVESDLSAYYSALYNFLKLARAGFRESIAYNFMINLLPFSHQISLWMHFDPKSAAYTPALRSKPGGHINYREAAWEISNHLANANPFLSALAIPQKPNPASREEFFDRS